MGSFKANGRKLGSRERRNVKLARRRGELNLEWLEERTLLSTLVHWQPSSSNLADVQHGPMANLGQQLIGVYESFVNSDGQTSQLASQYPNLSFNGAMVQAGFQEYGTNFSQLQTELHNLGMQVTVSSAYYGEVDGWIPISQLPTAAEAPDVATGFPIFKPELHYQGTADNQAETTTFANVARTQFGVNGAGVTVGVLSDSVNQYMGGLSESTSTGNLPTSPPVNVLQDGAAGGTDEGRAMLENIYDIAPGAGLAFATAEGGDLAMANNIQALATTANANLIVDDISYPDEPFFQDGMISQAINHVVTTEGVTYFSAAGNQGNGGYQSAWRGATGTVTGIGTGTFFNFDPTGGTLLGLPVTVTNTGPSVPLTFQFDQPFTTQQPAGSTTTVTSSLSFYAINTATNAVISGVANNVATQTPFQFITLPVGSYNIYVQLVSGTAPGHIQFSNTGDSANLQINKTFGSAGTYGIYYPTSVGHETAANTIGVGAVPWWATGALSEHQPA